MLKMDGLYQPYMPPTTADSADALDQRVYAQFDNDQTNLAIEPGSSKSYAFLPHGALVAYYDDNISATTTRRENDVAVAVEPGLAFGLGDFRLHENNYLTADYTGRWTSYLDHSSADAYEQFANLQAQLAFVNWKFNTIFRFLDLDDVDIDAGTRESRQIYDTAQVANYQISDKNFGEVQAENIVRDYESSPDSVEWQGRALYNYRWDPKLTLGGGFAGGDLAIDGASGQTYEQGLVRVLYDPTDKFQTQTQGGMELRQLGNGDDRATPVFDLNADFHLHPGTDFDFNAYRRIASSSSSFIQSLDYTATGVSLAAAQELGLAWLATMKIGYENNSYFYTDVGAGSPREDNFFYINPTLEFRFTHYAKLELFYDYRQNDSNNANRSFSDDQTGLRASFAY